MKNTNDALKSQLASLMTAPPAAPAPKSKPAAAVAARETYDRTTIGLYPKDTEIVGDTIRAASDLGYRLNATQAIRVLIRKGKGVTVTAADCIAATAEDPRRSRGKA